MTTVGLAALLSGAIEARDKRVGLILSGGNAEPLAVARRIDSLSSEPW